MMCAGAAPDDRVRLLLSQIRILRGCSSAQLFELGRVSRILRFDADRTIVDQGDAATSVLLVALGRVRLSVLGENGRELIIGDVDAGGCFGDEALGGASARRATATALVQSTVLSVPADAFTRFVAAYPRVALSLAAQLSAQLHAACDTVVGLGLLSVEERLLRTLEQLARQHGSRRPDGLVLPTRPTHRELAARVGARRETVTRTLESLTRRGLIVPEGAALLLRPAALQPG